jgi:ABC-type phosphate/phosphonate transport system substrate-binding protein
MYDWPEVVSETNELWGAISAALVERGFNAPAAISRSIGREEAWASDDLLVGQTCGLPFVQGVRDSAMVLGTFVYDVEQCAPGDYCSVIVAKPGGPTSIEEARGSIAAFNGRDSQSGHAAFVTTLAAAADGGSYFSDVVESGTHRRSMQLVAEGAADVAAVDVVSWLLANDVEPAASQLRVIASTACTPGLPLITNRRNADSRGDINNAISAAVDGVGSSVREALHISGFLPRTDSEYSVIADRLAEAERLGYPALI